MDNGASSYHRFLDGNKDALAEIIKMYSDGLVLYVNSIVKDPITADDIVDETFIKLYTDKPKFDGKSTFKTWLYSIARYTAIRHLRQIKRHPKISADDMGQISGYEDLEKEYIKNEEKINLHKALERLNPDHSQLLYLIYFEGFSNAETAKIIGKTNRQTSVLLYNAKKALKTELERGGVTFEEL